VLSPELAAGIRRVKGVKKLGVRLGNWLSATDARALWQSPDAETFKSQARPNDHCGPARLRSPTTRRLADLSFDHLQRREDRWAIVDLEGAIRETDRLLQQNPSDVDALYTTWARSIR
jgi:hypothetical protein